MGKSKAKAIQADLGIFRHNLVYPEIIQAYSGIFKYLCNPEIFRTRSIFRNMVYSQPWYIQNPRMFRMLLYSKSEAYSELCQTSAMKHFAKIDNGYDYFPTL